MITGNHHDDDERRRAMDELISSDADLVFGCDEKACEKRIRVFRRYAFLAGRSVAYDVRREILRFLAENPEGTVVLDFSDVRGVSHGFADELLSPLSEELGDATPLRVRIENASPKVLEMIRFVADMYGLTMPQIASGSPRNA